MKHEALLLALLPPRSYAREGQHLRAELGAEGAIFDGVRQRSDNVLNAVTPFYAHDLLPDWERVLDVTHENEDTYQQRLNRVLTKIAETGGLSIPYFKRLASSMGYHITIDELDAFRAGRNRAGDTIYSPDVIWIWRVNVFGSKVQTYRFRAGASTAGERLSYFADTVIETVFNDLKPAHTFCYFTYQG
ncbi:MAG: YmfQ family protein [Plesiomonas sp.]|uniref:YmfQ family protein n=1 Tax=Plesiomonas sp. TaxID=2486279 RepID=UPI003F3B6F5D